MAWGVGSACTLCPGSRRSAGCPYELSAQGGDLVAAVGDGSHSLLDGARRDVRRCACSSLKA